MAPSRPAEPESPKMGPRKPHRDNTSTRHPPSPPRVPAVAPQTPKKRTKSPTTVFQSPSAKKSRSCAPPVSQAKPNRDGLRDGQLVNICYQRTRTWPKHSPLGPNPYRPVVTGAKCACLHSAFLSVICLFVCLFVCFFPDGHLGSATCGGS